MYCVDGCVPMSACESMLVICIKRETERETERRDCCAEVRKVKTHKSHVSYFCNNVKQKQQLMKLQRHKSAPSGFLKKFWLHSFDQLPVNVISFHGLLLGTQPSPLAHTAVYTVPTNIK